jgi:hypothetical protein
MKVYISHDALQIGIYTVDATIFENGENIKFIQEGFFINHLGAITLKMR